MATIKGLAQKDGNDSVLKVALNNSSQEEFYWSLNLLWPNVLPILLRASEYIGIEVSLDGGEKPLLEQVLVSTKLEIDSAVKEGRVRRKGRDRDMLVFFLRGLLQGLSSLQEYRVSVAGEEWQFGNESFQIWRTRHQGKLEVQKLEGVDVDWETQINSQRRIARLILSEKDWAILDDDAERLWSLDGAPANQEEYEKEVDASEVVHPFFNRLN